MCCKEFALYCCFHYVIFSTEICLYACTHACSLTYSMFNSYEPKSHHNVTVIVTDLIKVVIQCRINPWITDSHQGLATSRWCKSMTHTPRLHSSLLDIAVDVVVDSSTAQWLVFLDYQQDRNDCNIILQCRNVEGESTRTAGSLCLENKPKAGVKECPCVEPASTSLTLAWECLLLVLCSISQERHSKHWLGYCLFLCQIRHNLKIQYWVPDV